MTQKQMIVDDSSIIELAMQVIQEKGTLGKIDIGDAKVRYVLVYPYISKTLAGRCIRCNNELSHFSDSDFIIEFSGELWDDLDDDRKYILMYHELKHIKAVYNSSSGEWKYSCRIHDVEDFADIIEDYGVHWITDIKTIMASKYDLDPETMESIKK